MAEASRSVSVVLRADIQDYVSKMNVASKATKDFATQTGKVSGSASTATKNLGASAASASSDLDKASKSTKGFGDASKKATDDVNKTATSTTKVSDASKQLGTNMALAGAAIALGVGLAVKAFADFDKEMSNVRAVSGATAGEMGLLRDAAIDAGQATKFSASEAASAEAELVKAGISVKEVLGGALTGSLNLAAAGNLDLANAANISAQAMNIFGLKGKDVGHIADVLAAGAAKSATDVGLLGDSLRQGGLVAAQTGLSLEETTGILSAFADNALIGSDAGTSLKTMLQRLVPQSAQAASAMHDIGFSAYDASGNLKSAADIAENLKTGLAGLTSEQRDSTLATIFGSDAVRAANVLYKLGASGVREYTKAVTDDGAAARIAAIQMDNLAGDLEQLRGSLETALIRAGSGGNTVLRDLAQTATTTVNALASLPAPVQATAVAVAAAAAATALLGGGLLTVVPKIAATRVALAELGVTSQLVRGVLGGPWGAAIVGATTVLGLFAEQQFEATKKAQELRDSLDQQTGAITDQTRAIVARNLQTAGALDVAERLGVSTQTLTRAALGEVDALDQLEKARSDSSAAAQGQYQSAVRAGQGLQAVTGQTNIFAKTQADAATATRGQTNSLQNLVNTAHASADILNPQIKQQQQLAQAMGGTATATDKVGAAASGAVGPGRLLGDEIKAQEQAAKDAQKAYDDLTDAVKNYGDQVATALSATSGYEASIDKAAEVAKKRKEIQDQINALQQGQGQADPKAAANAAQVKAEVDAANKKADIADATTRRNADAAVAKAKTQAEKDRIRANAQAALDKSAIDRQQRAAKLADAQGKSGSAAADNADQIARLKEQLQQYTATLDLSTEAGRANTAMLLDIAKGAKDAAVENFKNGVVYDEVKDRFIAGRQAFIDQAVAFGDTELHAKALADQLGLTEQNLAKLQQAPPANLTINANTAAADAAIANTGALLDATDGRVATVTIKTFVETQMSADIDQQIAMLSGTLGQGFAEGGYTGPGGKYEPVGVVHGREFVFSEEATAKAGVGNLENLHRRLRGYTDGGFVGPRFADRGLVSSAMTTHNINGGATTNDNQINIENLHGLTLEQVRRDADRSRRLHALGRRGAR